MKILILLLIIFSIPVSAEHLAPFTSDGCSDFPDGTFEKENLWLTCCIHHDYSYWKGGTYAERQVADKQLQQCVDSTGEPTIGFMMRVGVRIGGTPYLPTSFRWGYGWPYTRGYGELTKEELKQVEQYQADAYISK